MVETPERDECTVTFTKSSIRFLHGLLTSYMHQARKDGSQVDAHRARTLIKMLRQFL